MNIKHENVPGQVQTLVVEVQKADYAENVEKALKKQRREVSIPGFRKGNAPMSQVKRMYGSSILVYEIDRLVNEQINKFFEENKIQYVFEPMPVESETKADFENSEDFVFTYEYVLRPEVEIDYASLPVVTDFTIKPTTEEIDNYINDLRERHGKYMTPDEIAEKDSVSVTYGEDGNAFFFLKDLKEDSVKEFVGKKVGDTISMNMLDAFVSQTVFARAFNIEGKDFNAENSYSYDLTVKNIGRIEPAELNENFFKAAFANGDVTDEESLRNYAEKEIAAQYVQDTDRIFMNKAVDTILNNVNVELPDDFMKRYILAVQKDMKEEDLEKQFDTYKRSFKWQLIENKLVDGEDVKVTREDIENYFRDYFVNIYFKNFDAESVKEQVDKIVEQSMANQEYVKGAYDFLYDKKLTGLLRSKMNIDHKEGDFKAFVKEISSGSESNEVVEEKKSKKTTTKRKSAEKVEDAATENSEEVVEKPKKTRAKSTKKSE